MDREILGERKRCRDSLASAVHDAGAKIRSPPGPCHSRPPDIGIHPIPLPSRFIFPCRPMAKTISTQGAEKLHEEIATLARSYWEKEGCPNGRDKEHWFRA